VRVRDRGGVGDRVRAARRLRAATGHAFTLSLSLTPTLTLTLTLDPIPNPHPSPNLLAEHGQILREPGAEGADTVLAEGRGWG
jgi:hypothetical protein